MPDHRLYGPRGVIFVGAPEWSDDELEGIGAVG